MTSWLDVLLEEGEVPWTDRATMRAAVDTYLRQLRIGHADWSRKLGCADARHVEAAKMHANGATYVDIARRFRVTPPTAKAFVKKAAFYERRRPYVEANAQAEAVRAFRASLG